jgi:hypothetical protein
MTDNTQNKFRGNTPQDVWGFFEIKAGEIPTDIPEEPW